MEMNKKQDSLPMGSQEEMSAQIVLDETDDIELVDERRQKTYIEQIIYGFKNMPLERKVKAVIIAFLAIGIAVFHLYTSVFGTLPSWQHRSFHTGVMVSLCFILKPVGKNKFSKLVCDWIPFVLAITTCLYMFIQYPGSELRAGKPNTADIIFGTILTLLVIYAARRACGKAISYICLVALAYVWAGPYMPGLLAHPGFSYSCLHPAFLARRFMFPPQLLYCLFFSVHSLEEAAARTLLLIWQRQSQVIKQAVLRLSQLYRAA